MEFLDFSPPAYPTLDEQRDALQKGLGRSMQWAESGELDEDTLIDVCLNYPDLEDGRGYWLCKVIECSECEQKLCTLILNAIETVNNETDAERLCELAVFYADLDNDAIFKQLCSFVEQQRFPRSPMVGLKQLLIVGLDEGLRFIASLRGTHLETHEWGNHDDEVLRIVNDYFGESEVLDILAGSPDRDIQRFLAAWKERTANAAECAVPEPSLTRSSPIVSATDAFKVPPQDRKYDWCIWLGGDANEDDLKQCVERLGTEKDPASLATILEAMCFSLILQFDSRFVELASHPASGVRRAALKVMSSFSHPMVRDFALQHLQDQVLGNGVVRLFEKNFQEGDEDRLVTQLELPADIDERDEMLECLLAVLKANESADASILGQIIYFHTSSEECRYGIANLLHQRHVAPDWMLDECCSDSNLKCHSLGESGFDDD